ncbi:MAG: putative rane protein [Bacteroidota bacterium]|nr:putative rane protein [Bacteroidota bacterium]
MKQNLHGIKSKVRGGFVLRRVICVVLLSVLTATAYSQQIPVFSTYYFNKFLVNPAFTGIDNEYRAFGFFRSQWGAMPGRPITAGATLEGSFWKDRIGAGIFATNDKIGIFNRTEANVSYAQKIQFAKYHQISIGVQGGVFVNRIDFSDTHAKDFNDPGIANLTPSKTSFDLSVGISYKWKKLLVGFSVPNVMQSDAKYAVTTGTAADYQYIRHYTAYAQYKISIKKEMFNITPTLFMRKGPASGFQFDATVLLDYKNTVFIGGGYRNSFGAVIMAGANILNMFTVAYAYDYTTQPVLNGQVGSTHEVTFGFHLPSNYKRKKNDDSNINKDLLTSVQKSNDSLAASLKKNDEKLDSVLKEIGAVSETNKVLTKKVDSLTDVLNNEQTNNKETADQLKKERKKKNELEKELAKPKESFDIQHINTEKVEKGHVFTLDKIYFDNNKYELLPDSKEQLNSLAGLLKKQSKMEILIKGYTDNTGTDDFNRILSTLRAKAVYNYLIAEGVDEKRLGFLGYGSTNPITEENTDEGRRQNRRVEFTIVNK